MQRSGRIYLRVDDGLVAMTESAYDAEDVLQVLLAEYPDLLAGDQMRPEDPRRWLLIAREAGIPDMPGGLPRWSIDHLFIDQDAVPTLVEVKRSSDTRIRREVVGQMLDYAANVVAHWPPGELRDLFEERCRLAGLDPDAEVIRLLGGPEEADGATLDGVDGFWTQAGDNLSARRLRLVFVADIIPVELQSIVEFLNENLVETDVLAVEVKQYLGEGRQTLVPRVIGRTAAAGNKHTPPRPPRVTRTWDDETFLAEVVTAGDPRAEALVRDALGWLARLGHSPVYGRGKGGPLYLNAPTTTGASVGMVAIYASGRVEIEYGTLQGHPPFDVVTARLELNHRLNELPGANVDERGARIGGWPSLRIEALPDATARHRFLSILDWVAGQLAAPAGGSDATGTSTAPVWSPFHISDGDMQ